jgi:hypothetical protein
VFRDAAAQDPARSILIVWAEWLLKAKLCSASGESQEGFISIRSSAPVGGQIDPKSRFANIAMQRLPVPVGLSGILTLGKSLGAGERRLACVSSPQD